MILVTLFSKIISLQLFVTTILVYGKRLIMIKALPWRPLKVNGEVNSATEIELESDSCRLYLHA